MSQYLFEGKDDTHWTKTQETSSGGTNDYCGKVDGGGSHCHMSNNDGNIKVDHRGDCKVCDDEKSGGASTTTPWWKW